MSEPTFAYPSGAEGAPNLYQHYQSAYAVACPTCGAPPEHGCVFASPIAVDTPTCDVPLAVPHDPRRTATAGRKGGFRL